MNPAELPRQNPFLIYWRRIGGGSLLLSLTIHAVLIVGAVLLIGESFVERPVYFNSGTRNTQSDDGSSQFAETVRVKQSAQREQSEKHRITSAKVDVPISIPEQMVEPAFVGQQLNGDILRSATPSGFPSLTGGMNGVILGYPLIPGSRPSRLWNGRCGAVERMTRIRDNGGSDQCERAVSLALEWLKTQQNKDGSWGRQHRGAMTGLGLLCYLGRCELPDSPFYGPQVQQGLLYLIELGAKNEFGIFSEKVNNNSACYEHGLATYALGEMYAMAKLGQNSLPGMRDAFEKGVHVIIDHQLPDGGWGYGDGFCYRKTGAGDLSVTGWQFQALKAAKYSGLTIPDLHRSIDRAVKYLVSKQTKDGGFGNANREQGYNQWNLTGAGVLGLQTLGGGRHPNEIRRGVKFARDFFTKEPPRWDTNASLYAWYYYAQAFFQNGGDAWKQWNDAALHEILGHQNQDGSWQIESAGSSVASTAPAGADRAIYRTALCTLMLEVYYRYLKVGDRDDHSPFERKP